MVVTTLMSDHPFSNGEAPRRWSPGNFESAASRARPASPPPSPEPTFQFPTAEELETLQEQARQEGYDAGYREGLAQGQPESAALLAFSDAFHAEITRLDEAVAAEVASLAMSIAQRVIGVAHHTDPTLVARVAEHALQALPANFDPARIQLNPADLAVVHQHLGEEFAGRRITLSGNPGVTRGGCRVMTSTTDIDGTLESRWLRVAEVLGGQPWPGLAAVPALDQPVAARAAASAEPDQDEPA